MVGDISTAAGAEDRRWQRCQHEHHLCDKHPALCLSSPCCPASHPEEGKAPGAAAYFTEQRAAPAPN